jgi:alkanesulfonate monooxygenase
MTIEFIGIAATAPHSETEIAAPQSDPVQPGYLEELARAHEDAGFDRVLVAHSSASPDGFTVADQVLSRTQRLGVLLAHRPGFVAPTYAAPQDDSILTAAGRSALAASRTDTTPAPRAPTPREKH